VEIGIMAAIDIERAPGVLADRRSTYEVVIDGETRGMLAPDQARSFDVSPGVHAVVLRIGQQSLQAMKVAVLSRTRLTCKPRVAQGLGLYTLSAPEAWISVREAAA
jgi:hypothetical protein